MWDLLSDDINSGLPQEQPVAALENPQTRLYSHGHFNQQGRKREVNKSGKRNVIFVAPTLGPRSQAGNLINKGGFDNYINKVLAAINEYAIKNHFGQHDISLGNIILSAHSGGGLPMIKIIQRGDSYAQKVSECWGFDSTYGPVEQAWMTWTKNNSVKLFI